MCTLGLRATGLAGQRTVQAGAVVVRGATSEKEQLSWVSAEGNTQGG